MWRAALSTLKVSPHPLLAPSLDRHGLYEDGVAMLGGTLLVSLGMTLFARSALVSGGVAGLALLLQTVTHIGLGTLFFVINLPFYWFAVRRMGWTFAIRTFLAVCLTAVLNRLTPEWIALSHIDHRYAAMAGGTLMGVGLVMLFRHRIGLGGINILAMYLQERTGLRAGYVQLAVDGAILAAGALILPVEHLFLSVLGVAITNLILALNHKPGRYNGTSGQSARYGPLRK